MHYHHPLFLLQDLTYICCLCFKQSRYLVLALHQWDFPLHKHWESYSFSLSQRESYDADSLIETFQVSKDQILSWNWCMLILARTMSIYAAWDKPNILIWRSHMISRMWLAFPKSFISNWMLIHTFHWRQSTHHCFQWMGCLPNEVLRTHHH